MHTRTTREVTYLKIKGTQPHTPTRLQGFFHRATPPFVHQSIFVILSISYGEDRAEDSAAFGDTIETINAIVENNIKGQEKEVQGSEDEELGLLGFGD